jgi:hypothetical protein
MIMKHTVEEAARIEREKILQELKDGYSKHKDTSLYNAFAATIEKYAVPLFKDGAEWQSKQSPWISVKERLPEKNTGVFFTVEWKDSRKGYFVGLYYGNGQWESDNRIFLQDSPLYRITHYMPIPSFDDILEANRDVLERIKEKGD